MTITAGSAPIDIYARRSRKGDKQQRSTGGQVSVCKAVLAERGLPLGTPHVDDGKSAWNPRVRRPGWDSLMARLESGQAGGVIVFDMERFSRRPIEGERLIQAAERGMVVLDSDGEFDLTTASGKKSFRDAMNAAAYYSDRLSDRVRRGKKLKALAGEPHGRVSTERGPFGFLPDGMTQHPGEAAELRGIAARFLAGETQDSLIADLDARGVLTAIGGTWTRRSLHDVLVRPLNAGLVVHRGEVVATLPGEPLIGRDDYDRILAMYAARRPGRPPGGKYLCSGMVTCGLCGKPLGGRPRAHLAPYADGTPKREYWCTRTGYGGCGRITADQRALDAHARELAIAVLSDAEQANAAEVAAAGLEAEAAELDTAIAKAEELRVKLADRLGRGELELDVFDAAAGPLDKRLAGLRGQRKALGSAPARVPADSEAVWRRRWGAGTPEERREWLKQALRGRQLVVSPGRDVAGRVSLG